MIDGRLDARRKWKNKNNKDSANMQKKINKYILKSFILEHASALKTTSDKTEK